MVAGMVGTQPSTKHPPHKYVCSLTWRCRCGRTNACHRSRPMLPRNWKQHEREHHVCAGPHCAGRAVCTTDALVAAMAELGLERARPPIDPQPLAIDNMEQRDGLVCSRCGCAYTSAKQFRNHRASTGCQGRQSPARLWRQAGKANGPWLVLPAPADADQQRRAHQQQHQQQVSAREGRASTATQRAKSKKSAKQYQSEGSINFEHLTNEAKQNETEIESLRLAEA